MINYIRGIFQPRNIAKNELSFSEADIQAAIKKNRESLNQVDNWIDEEAFGKSWFQYGVPEYIRNDINKKINNTRTYTDIMLVIARNYFSKISYLEIGVSVGKNFFQLLNAIHGSKMTGFDIEEINPIVEQRLLLRNKTEWTTPANSIKKNTSSLKTYGYQDNLVQYVCADVWDQNSWSKLEGNKFNLVFSDALHSSEAILFEFDMLVKYNLLDDKFVIIWDDLVGKMKTAFFKIVKKYHEQYNIQDVYLLNINGWIGEHEGPHSVGIISNFPLK